MNPNNYFQVYKSYVIDLIDCFYLEETLLGLDFKEEIHLVDGLPHPFITNINLN